MKLLSTIFIIALSCSFAFAETALPSDIIVSASVLLENGKIWNNKQVTISGELIGEPMPRGTQVWFNVLCQDGNAIGVVASSNLLDKTLIYGDYWHRGAKVLVKGLFLQFAKQYSGETCVIANNLIRLEEGYATPHPHNKQKLILIAVLMGMILFVAILARIALR